MSELLISWILVRNCSAVCSNKRHKLPGQMPAVEVSVSAGHYTVFRAQSVHLYGQGCQEREIRTNTGKIEAPVLYFNFDYCYRHFR